MSNTASPAGVADFGQVQVRLVGQSTGRPWSLQTLPNFKIDSDEFQQGLRIGGVKHARFNNAIVGGIYREKLTLDLYRQLRYPAPKATYAWVSSNVWGAETRVPYVVVESYKPQFCKSREKQFGEECVNMWEFAGDFGMGGFELPENCQFSECDASRVNELEDAVVSTPPGDGFKAALAEWIDWEAFHRFQCLSWVLETGDDAIHSTASWNERACCAGDEGRYEMLREHIEERLLELPIELEKNRDAPDTSIYCDEPLVDCGGYCAFPEGCVLCEPGPIVVDPRPLRIAAAEEPEGAPLPEEPSDPDAGVLGDPADGVDDPNPDPDPVDEPLPPGVCLPPIDNYAL